MRSKIGLLVLCILLWASLSQSKSKEPDKDEIILSKTEWNALNQKLDLWLAAIVAFVVKEIYAAWKNKGKDIDATLKLLIDSNTEIKTTLKSLATTDAARQISRDEIRHMLDLRKS